MTDSSLSQGLFDIRKLVMGVLAGSAHGLTAAEIHDLLKGARGVSIRPIRQALRELEDDCAIDSEYWPGAEARIYFIEANPPRMLRTWIPAHDVPSLHLACKSTWFSLLGTLI